MALCGRDGASLSPLKNNITSPGGGGGGGGGVVHESTLVRGSRGIHYCSPKARGSQGAVVTVGLDIMIVLS